MLHTLNKAWIDIMMRQAVKNPTKIYLFAISNSNPKELDMVADAILSRGDVILSRGEILTNSFVATENMIYELMEKSNTGVDGMPIFDDILISHDIHDIFIKDYLARHCKRKGA